MSSAQARDAPSAILVNGVAAPTLDARDRGLHFGDGLFETIACPGGRPRLLDWHLERLAAGCARLAIELPDPALLRAEIIGLAGASETSLLKLIVTRGIATVRGYGARGDERSTRILLRYPWPAERPEWTREGVALRTSALRLGENPALAGLKHLNRLEQILARAEWSDPAIQESLLLSSSGRLVSGTMSNVFLVHEMRLATPRLDRCGVAGVMRRAVMSAALRAGIAVEETELDAAALAGARELFLTNARVGIWPARSLDGRVLEVGSVTRRVQQALAPILEGVGA